MHRGSSKAPGVAAPGAETLPLSASPADDIPVDIEVSRAARVHRHQIRVARGTLIRAAIRRIGLSPEGVAVLIDGVSVPLDQPIDRPVRLEVIPTFSGG